MPPQEWHPLTNRKSKRIVVQCTGHTKSGRRCKRKTARSNLCYAHLESEKHLAIKPSHIRGAGLGLYTTVPRPPGRRITDYTGEEIVTNRKFGGPYVLTIKDNPPTHIDAYKTSEPGLGRWANAARARDGVRNNAHLSVNHHPGIIATRPIPNATKRNPREIFVSYGRNARNEYWAHQDDD
jgi:hypothetical protein